MVYYDRDFIHQQPDKTAFVSLCVCTHLYPCACEMVSEGDTPDTPLPHLCVRLLIYQQTKALDMLRELCLIR